MGSCTASSERNSTIPVCERRMDRRTSCDDSIGNRLSMVCLHQHNIGYTADGFYRSDDPTNSVKALKEGG